MGEWSESFIKIERIESEEGDFKGKSSLDYREEENGLMNGIFILWELIIFLVCYLFGHFYSHELESFARFSGILRFS